MVVLKEITLPRKNKSSLPTVSLYALMDSCEMDALDDRKVIMVDIPGAFLQGE